MPLKKVDSRIKTLIENGVALRQRSLFVVVGDKGRDQVVILHHMLSKAVIKARPSVLWCYKKELGFSSHRRKRMRQLQKKIKSGTLDLKQDDPFELFVAATTIRYCYYAETHKILGNTYGMCVLQDFEALTPNLLARTIETVEGGGVIVLLLRTLTSLKQLYTMTMDVHARYRTEAHQEVTARFNERFILSLGDCRHCIVLDDQLNILPVSTHMLHFKPHPPSNKEECTELEALRESMADTQPVGSLLSSAKTLDQAKALLKFVEAISEQTLKSTVTMTAARGRGKSATLGLAIAAAVSFGYSNIFVTSPSPENLKTLFEFVFQGFDAVGYSEHEHYEIVQSTNPEFNKAVVRVNVFSQHRQTIQYIAPGDGSKLGHAELVVIDEAAAIPLPLVRQLLGPHLVFMASTINGYEGTGRSLSLKLISELRQQSTGQGATGRALRETSLSEPIRYSQGDPIESWLHTLLCLDVSCLPRVASGAPPPPDCQLYYINRDTLFCYHKASEEFLQRLMSLYVSSHYKNSPNDLQMLSDAPAHHIFVLLGPISAETVALPEILCVVQVCLEGSISRGSVMSSLARGKRASGDLIPWTISQQFSDADFAGLSGARVVRIATHADFQSMGYGSRALQLLNDYYSGEIASLTEGPPPSPAVEPTVTEPGLLKETIAPRSHLPPLLTKLSDRPPEELDYLGVSFGLTAQLMKFWSTNGFLPVYLRQTTNDLTGEHSCIMIRTLREGEWLQHYNKDFRKRMLSLLAYQFREFPPSLSLSLLQNKHSKSSEAITTAELSSLFSPHDLKRLEQYSRNLVDYHLVIDLLPAISRLYFGGRSAFKLSAVQSAILLGLGLQHKTVDQLQKELDLPSGQILGLFNRLTHKFVQLFKSLQESAVDIATPTVTNLQPLKKTIDEELSTSADKTLESVDLSQYSVCGGDWGLTDTTPSIVSVARSADPIKRKITPSHSKSVKKFRKNK
ncbi:RNA cytidine acetyltransferase-like [Halichondria panicea]|uniref:RNA cytidine acetyltransferase-like n=1 Tax=Halichondria panicea TaxID=6063 RepID=UPI00312B7941